MIELEHLRKNFEHELEWHYLRDNLSEDLTPEQQRAVRLTAKCYAEMGAKLLISDIPKVFHLLTPLLETKVIVSGPVVKIRTNDE